MSKKMTIELEQSNSCCSPIHSGDLNSSIVALINELQSSGSDIALLNAQPCCKNEKLFIKLGNQLLSKTLTLIKNFTPHITYILSAQLSGNLLDDINYYFTSEIPPPGPPYYIELASLRL